MDMQGGRSSVFNSWERQWLNLGSCTSCSLNNETAQQPAAEDGDAAQAPAQLNVLEPVRCCDPAMPLTVTSVCIYKAMIVALRSAVHMHVSSPKYVRCVAPYSWQNNIIQK